MKKIVFEVEDKPGWRVELTYEEGESAPRIQGTDENGRPLSKETLDSMRVTLAKVVPRIEHFADS